MLRFKNHLMKKIQAAGVVARTEGDSTDRIRLLKLLYIADRESLQERGMPIVGGRVSALDNGPLHSDVYDLIKGEHIDEPTWSRFFRNDGHIVKMINDPGRDELSQYEIEKLTEVSERFHSCDSWELVEKTHEFSEWLQCHKEGSSRTIPLEVILKVLGFDDEDIRQIVCDAEMSTRMHNLLITQ